MDKHKRKVDLDEDDEPAGRPWLSYLLFALVAFAIVMFGLLAMIYSFTTYSIVSDPHPWGPGAR